MISTLSIFVQVLLLFLILSLVQKEPILVIGQSIESPPLRTAPFSSLSRLAAQSSLSMRRISRTAGAQQNHNVMFATLGLRRSFGEGRTGGFAAPYRITSNFLHDVSNYRLNNHHHYRYDHYHRGGPSCNIRHDFGRLSFFRSSASSSSESYNDTLNNDKSNNNKIKNPLTGRWITINKSSYQSLLQNHGYINFNGEMYKIGAGPYRDGDANQDENINTEGTRSASNALPITILQRCQIHNGLNENASGKTVMICSKPSGLLTVPGIEEHDSLVSRICKQENFKTNTNKTHADGDDHCIMEVKACHRLDRDTSGIVVLGVEPTDTDKKFPKHKKKKKNNNKKSSSIVGFIAKQFQDRTVQKQYVSLVYGWISQDTGMIHRPIGKGKPVPIESSSSGEKKEPSYYRPWVLDGDDAREAITEWKVLERRQIQLEEQPNTANEGNTAATSDTNHIGENYRGNHNTSDTKNVHNENVIRYTKVLLQPKTGRGHQLRLHMSSMGHPILGDWLHAPTHIAQLTPRLCLHAETLDIDLPTQLFNDETTSQNHMRHNIAAARQAIVDPAPF